MPDERISPDEPKPPHAVEPEVEARPRRKRDLEFDEEYDRPRRRDEEGDSTGGLIPYKNGLALGAYYTGVFSLIPIFGVILGPIAIVLGIMGFKYANKHPTARGKAHAIVGTVLGLLVLLAHVGCVGFAFVSSAFR